MSEWTEMTCPFCGEAEFDAPGLKSHLLNGDCEPFNETEDLQRLRFAEPWEAVERAGETR